MSIDLENLYTEAQEESQKMAGGSTKNPKILNCNRNTTVYFKLTPSYNTDGNPKLLKPFATYNFKTSKDKNARSHYAGTAPSSLGLPDVIVDKRNEHFNNGEKDVGGRMYPTSRALYSVFVISDSENSENDGKFMILNTGNKEKSDYGKGSPFKNFIDESKSDPDEPKSLNDIYSMGESDLRIRMDIEKADKNAIPDISYKWVRKDKNPFSKADDIQEFFKENALDLDQEVEPPKSDEELLSLYNKHILGVTTENSTRVDTPSIPDMGSPEKEEDVDDIPMKDEDFTNLKKAGDSEDESDEDDEIKKMLAGLDDLDD